MGAYSGPNVVDDSLVFYYDTFNQLKSYRGEPTTNLVRYSNNVTGSNYGYLDEYDVCDLVKTYNPNLKTPIGTGATLLTQQAVTSFWHALNWFDAEENGQKCLSAFIYPVTPGITNFFLGLIADGSNGVVFNLDTLEITYGNGISNRNAYIRAVPGYPGWYRVAANIEGRTGGWVASIGIGQYAEYTPSAPFKSFYLCGLQYESGVSDHITQPLPSLSGTITTRSATQGLIDLTGNSTIDLTNVSFDSNAQMTFDGTNDYVDLGSYLTGIDTSVLSIELVFRSNIGTGGYMPLLGWMENEAPHGYICTGDFTGYWGNESISFFNSGPTALSFAYTNGHAFLNDTNYHHVVFILQTGGYKIYVDGSEVAVNSSFRNGSMSTTMPSNLFGYGSTPSVAVGAGSSPAAYANARVPIVKVYNRALTASEVQSNYQAIRTRYGI